MTDILQLIINLSVIVPMAMNIVALVSVIIGVVMTATALADIWQRSSIGLSVGLQGGDTVRMRSIIGRLIIGSVLVTSLYWLNITGNTLLAGQTVNGSSFLYQSAGMSSNQQVAFRAILDFFILTGYLAFIKGWLIWQKFFDNVTREGFGKGFVHILFGTLLVYLDNLMDIAGEWTGFHFIGTLIS